MSARGGLRDLRDASTILPSLSRFNIIQTWYNYNMIIFNNRWINVLHARRPQWSFAQSNSWPWKARQSCWERSSTTKSLPKLGQHFSLAKAKVTEANRKQMPKKYKVAQADLPSPTGSRRHNHIHGKGMEKERWWVKKRRRCSCYRPDCKSSLSIPAQEDVIEGFWGNQNYLYLDHFRSVQSVQNIGYVAKTCAKHSVKHHGFVVELTQKHLRQCNDRSAKSRPGSCKASNKTRPKTCRQKLSQFYSMASWSAMVNPLAARGANPELAPQKGCSHSVRSCHKLPRKRPRIRFDPLKLKGKIDGL